MLENIVFSATAVLPLIILIFFGTFLKSQKKLFTNPEDFFNQLEKFVFNIALPVYIFSQIAQAEIDKDFDAGLVLYCVCAIILSCAAMIIITPFFIKSKKVRGAYIHGICRPNFVLLGVPLISNLTDEAGAAAAVLVLPFMVPLFNILGTVILASHADKDAGDGAGGAAILNSTKKILTEIVKNPLIRAIIIGLPFMLFGIEIPDVIQRSINHIRNTSTPLALISLGAGVYLQAFKSKITLPLTASIIKMLVCPVIFVAAAVLIGFRGETLAVIYVLGAAPTAVVSYIMAKNMHSDAELARQIVTFTTLMCPVTIFLGSLILKSTGLI